MLEVENFFPTPGNKIFFLDPLEWNASAAEGRYKSPLIALTNLSQLPVFLYRNLKRHESHHFSKGPVSPRTSQRTRRATSSQHCILRPAHIEDINSFLSKLPKIASGVIALKSPSWMALNAGVEEEKLAIWQIEILKYERRGSCWVSKSTCSWGRSWICVT
jgi:hypothetical protein